MHEPRQNIARPRATRIRAAAGQVWRYGLATLGPVSTAAAQFLLSLQLLHVLTPEAFGSFSFLLLTSQFSFGIWSALFCAPLPIVLSGGEPGSRQRTARCLFSTSLALSIVAFFAFWTIGAGLGTEGHGALLFAAYAALFLLRWFARAYAYFVGGLMRPMMSDIAYSAILLVGMVLIHLLETRNTDLPYAILLAGAVVGLLPFGRDYLARQFVHVSPRDLPAYSGIWRHHSGWSLTGVVTTEATANAHAYIVTLIVGPAAFAVVAASGLLIRPVTVAMNALTEFERPRMARQIAQSQFDLAGHGVRLFRYVLIAGWLVSSLGAVGLFIVAPRLLFPGSYALSDIILGSALWMAVALVRLLRTPDSVLLQAAGMFRPLAFASIWSAGVSVAAVAVMLLAGGPIWSIAGILIGEAVFAVFIWRAAWRWRATADTPSEQGGEQR